MIHVKIISQVLEKCHFDLVVIVSTFFKTKSKQIDLNRGPI